MIHPYRAVLRIRRFRLLWIGDTLSSFGDSVGFLALVWIVYATAGDATTLGVFVAAYTAPVVIGGPLAGKALDSFDRRRLMLADNIGRGSLMMLVPLLHYADALHLWHLYVVAVVYGSLRMIPLAGVPSLIPDLVPSERLDAANALETVSFFLSAVVGAGLAGVLIGAIGGANVLWLDAASYFAFAVALWRIGTLPRPSEDAASSRGNTIREAAAFALATPILLATTLMYMLVNVGEGILSVVTPVYTREILHAGPGTYGALVGVAAAAGLLGALAAGSMTPRISIGRAIAMSEIASGCAYAALAAKPGFALTLVVLGAGALFLGPLTVWGQTIRMSLIPPEMRGRVFGLLRTTMQSTPPLGALLAGPLLATGGVRLAAVTVAGLIALPAAIALRLQVLEFETRPAHSDATVELAESG